MSQQPLSYGDENGSITIVGPILHEDTDPLPEGYFFTLAQGDYSGDSLLFYFPFLDTPPIDPDVLWTVYSGFYTREAAEERRRHMLTYPGIYAIDDKATFWAVVELCRNERWRTHARTRRQQRRKAMRRIERAAEGNN